MPTDFQDQLLNSIEDLIEAIEKKPQPRDIVIPPSPVPKVEVRVPQAAAPSVQVDAPSVTVTTPARSYTVDNIKRDGQNFIKSFSIKSA